MSKDAKPAQKRIDQFLSGPGGRADDWRDLVEGAKVWARGGDRAIYDATLADLSVTEWWSALVRRRPRITFRLATA